MLILPLFFTALFYNKTALLARTFAQLLHNEDVVVSKLIEHLQVKDSMAYDALLE